MQNHDNLVYSSKYFHSYAYLVCYKDKNREETDPQLFSIAAIVYTPGEAYNALCQLRENDEGTYREVVRDVVLLDSFNINVEEYCKKRTLEVTEEPVLEFSEETKI